MAFIKKDKKGNLIVLSFISSKKITSLCGCDFISLRRETRKESFKSKKARQNSFCLAYKLLQMKTEERVRLILPHDYPSISPFYDPRYPGSPASPAPSPPPKYGPTPLEGIKSEHDYCILPPPPPSSPAYEKTAAVSLAIPPALLDNFQREVIKSIESLKNDLTKKIEPLQTYVESYMKNHYPVSFGSSPSSSMDTNNPDPNLDDIIPFEHEITVDDIMKNLPTTSFELPQRPIDMMYQ